MSRPYSPTRSFRLLRPRLVSSASSRFDKKYLLNGHKTSTPTIIHTMPTGKNEKNDNPSCPASTNASSITKLGGVPINVSIPPILLAKAKGISNVRTFVLALAAILTTIGSINATVPVLLTKAPITAVTNMTNK